MRRLPLLRVTSAGLYCELGGFHIDPWHPVSRAVVTHAHADHFVVGCKSYLTAAPGRGILQRRLGPPAVIQAVPYGEPVDLAGIKVSLHPAGHMLGSAQVRVEHAGEVWVASGDYKVAPDPTCEPFEPVRCHTFITESTFAHPFFAWQPQEAVFEQIHAWWRQNQANGFSSLLYAYSLGKAQRLLAGLDAEQGPIFAHPAIEELNRHYRDAGVALEGIQPFSPDIPAVDWQRAIVVLPPTERWHPTLAKLASYRTAFASGWMALPDGPRQRRVQTGFPLSDHADHQEILATVRASGAERVFATHGYSEILVDILQSQGLAAAVLRTPRCHRPPAIPAVQRELEFE
ncbi:MAG: ligase-associated DNA damage response exonuclease [Planctomycetaceae bacterium]